MARVLITGTSSGIGLATAVAFARAGHTVYATMRNPAGAPELGHRAASEELPITVAAMDVDSDESVNAGIERIVNEGGAIDVLVNNAGIERSGSVEELPLAEFRAVMETNYFGALRCIKAVIPAMRARRRGCIINIASIAGRIACSPLAPYAASKFALEALSESLAQEMKPFNVRVAIVEPGIIDTPMARRIENPPNPSRYPQQRRFGAMFTASLKNPAVALGSGRRRWSTSSTAALGGCVIRWGLMRRGFSAGAGRWATRSGSTGEPWTTMPGMIG